MPMESGGASRRPGARRMSSPRRVLLIGLDAAEPSRIEEGSARGRLPEIAALLGRGTYGRLATTAGLLSGSPWPTFYTGSSPAAHGLYHHMQWRPERARLERPSDRWLPVLPFWRAFPDSGPRAVVLDAPMTYPPAPFPGFEIAGWATHDHLGPPASHPGGALADARRAFGRDLVAEEVHGLQKLGDLRALGASLARASEMVGEAGEALLRREPWDLFFVTFGTLHRAGHKLWDETAVRGAASPEDVESIAASLDGVYGAVDRAVGRLVRAAGNGTAVVLFSLHGMGPNRNRSPLLPEMLRRVLAGSSIPRSAGASRGGFSLLRGLVPRDVRRGVKESLPVRLRDRLTAFWVEAAGARRPAGAFALPADLHGYVRINRSGRDARGIVPAETEAALVEEIREGLSTFREAASGERLVAEVTETRRLLGPGARSDRLPDLVVRWCGAPAARHASIVSERFGEIRWPTPGRNPDGRSGNHLGEGFVLAAGEGIPHGERAKDASILDLAPTVLALLGTPPPFPMEGKPIAPIAR